MSLQLRTSTFTFLYKLLWFISTWFNLRRPIRWWTTDFWRGPSIAPVTSTRGTGTWMWSANVSTISATLPSRKYQTQPSQTRPISSLLISTLPNLNFPNLKFSLHILKLTHFNLAQSQTQPILDTPDFKLFIFQTHLVSWFVQHTNVLQHSLFVLCLRLSVLLCTNTIKNSLNPAHYCLRCFLEGNLQCLCMCPLDTQ